MGNHSIFLNEGLEVDKSAETVVKNGERINLRPKEWEIFIKLIRNKNKILTKKELYESVWGYNYFNDDNLINVHIRKLREKIEEDPSIPKIIKTVWGKGYIYGEIDKEIQD